MPLDMPPQEAISAMDKDLEAPAHIIKQEEGESAEAMLSKMMEREGVAFAPKMEIKKTKLKNPNEEILNAEIKRNLDENDRNILKNADKNADKGKLGGNQYTSAY